MKCSLCNGPIEVTSTGWSTGNDAWPVVDGRCCYNCNFEVVIPARIAGVGAFRTATAGIWGKQTEEEVTDGG